MPLGSVATLENDTGPVRVVRFNLFPAAEIQGQGAPGVSSGEALQAMEQYASQLPPGFGYEWTGQSLQEKLSGSQAPLLLGLSALVVFLCLAALYESWTIPLAVLLTVPLGIAGAVLAATFRGLPNDVYFTVGLVAIIVILLAVIAMRPNTFRVERSLTIAASPAALPLLPDSAGRTRSH